eukprot:365000-Chlamydomonas_euryale.AAC.2
MLDVLVIKNLDSTVEEDALPPDGMDDAATARALKQARAIIRLHVSNNLVPIIGGTDDARSAWVTLEDTFRINLMPRRLALTKQLNSVKLSRGESIAAYYARVCALCDELVLAGERVETHSLVVYILAGLPPAYQPVVVQIEDRADEDLSLENVVRQLRQQESRVTVDEHVEAAFTARVPSGAHIKPALDLSAVAAGCRDRLVATTALRSATIVKRWGIFRAKAGRRRLTVPLRDMRCTCSPKAMSAVDRAVVKRRGTRVRKAPGDWWDARALLAREAKIDPSGPVEPTSRSQAMSCANREDWLKAEAEEVANLMANETWELVKCPLRR